MKSLTLVFATLLVSSLADTAHARSPAHETPQREVRIADLDLSQAAHIKKLQRRINIAAREVCGNPGLARTLWPARIRQCVKESTERALADVTRLRASTTRIAGELK